MVAEEPCVEAVAVEEVPNEEEQVVEVDSLVEEVAVVDVEDTEVGITVSKVIRTIPPHTLVYSRTPTLREVTELAVPAVAVMEVSINHRIRDTAEVLDTVPVDTVKGVVQLDMVRLLVPADMVDIHRVMEDTVKVADTVANPVVLLVVVLREVVLRVVVVRDISRTSWFHSRFFAISYMAYCSFLLQVQMKL